MTPSSTRRPGPWPVRCRQPATNAAPRPPPQTQKNRDHAALIADVVLRNLCAANALDDVARHSDDRRVCTHYRTIADGHERDLLQELRDYEASGGDPGAIGQLIDDEARARTWALFLTTYESFHRPRADVVPVALPSSPRAGPVVAVARQLPPVAGVLPTFWEQQHGAPTPRGLAVLHTERVHALASVLSGRGGAYARVLLNADLMRLVVSYDPRHPVADALARGLRHDQPFIVWWNLARRRAVSGGPRLALVHRA